MCIPLILFKIQKFLNCTIDISTVLCYTTSVLIELIQLVLGTSKLLLFLRILRRNNVRAQIGGISLFDIRLEGKQPIYEQLCEKIAALISSGILEAGERLPTVRETAKSLGINPNTVQRAYNRLEQDGFIYSVPAKGSYVSENGSAADAMMKKVIEELKNGMISAKNAGMTKDDAVQLLESVWAK